MEEAGYIGHEGDRMLSEAREYVDKRIDEVWTAKEEVVEADAINARAGVVAHANLVVLIHRMHWEVPSWKLRVHLIVGDVDGVSFIIKFFHLLKQRGQS